jgi:hypothetical protein
MPNNSSIVACIRCNRNVFTKPSPSNNRRYTLRLMGGIYAALRRHGRKCRDVHTKFHIDWSRDSKVVGGGDTYKHTQTARWFRKPTFIFSLHSLFCKNKSRLMRSLTLCVHPPINFWMPEAIFKKLGMHIMVPESISTAYFVNPSHHSVCLYVYPPIVARQRLSINVTVAMNTHPKIEELLDASFSVRSVSYQMKVGD